MRINKLAVVLVVGGVLATGCKDPAEGKTKAEVSAPAASAAPKAAEGQVEKLAISSETSKVNWVGSKVTGSHDGSFQKFSGNVELVDGKITGGKIEVTIDATSMQSDSEKLTGHLKSADFFDVEKFPEAKFTSTKIDEGGADDATHTITGNLELHGQTKSIKFPATVAITDSEATATSEFSINRKDFEINYAGMKDDLIRDDVVIKLDIKVSRKKS